MRTLKLLLLISCLTIGILAACEGNSQGKSQASSSQGAKIPKDTVIMGSITKLSVYNYRGKSFKLEIEPKPRIELQIKFEIDPPQNPVLEQFFIYKDGTYHPNGNAVGKNFKFSCSRSDISPSGPDNNPIYYITKAEAIGRSNSSEDPREIIGTLVGVGGGGDTTSIFLDTKSGTVGYRLFYENNRLKVNTGDRTDVFTFKHYSTQLNDKYVGQRVTMIVEEKPVYTTVGNMDSGIFTKVALGWAVTSIKFESEAGTTVK